MLWIRKMVTAFIFASALIFAALVTPHLDDVGAYALIVIVLTALELCFLCSPQGGLLESAPALGGLVVAVVLVSSESMALNKGALVFMASILVMLTSGWLLRHRGYIPRTD